jgi:hypothetical protein
VGLITVVLESNQLAWSKMLGDKGGVLFVVQYQSLQFSSAWIIRFDDVGEIVKVNPIPVREIRFNFGGIGLQNRRDFDCISNKESVLNVFEGCVNLRVVEEKRIIASLTGLRGLKKASVEMSHVLKSI